MFFAIAFSKLLRACAAKPNPMRTGRKPSRRIWQQRSFLPEASYAPSALTTIDGCASRVLLRPGEFGLLQEYCVLVGSAGIPRWRFTSANVIRPAKPEPLQAKRIVDKNFLKFSTPPLGLHTPIDELGASLGHTKAHQDIPLRRCTPRWSAPGGVWGPPYCSAFEFKDRFERYLGTRRARLTVCC